MLFVKNMMFLDGAIATLAPDLDILEEIQKVHTEIGTRHGERLAARDRRRSRARDRVRRRRGQGGMGCRPTSSGSPTATCRSAGR